MGATMIYMHRRERKIKDKQNGLLSMKRGTTRERREEVVWVL